MKRAQRFLKYVLFAFVYFSVFVFSVNAETLSTGELSDQISLNSVTIMRSATIGYGKNVAYSNRVTIGGASSTNKFIFEVVKPKFNIACRVVSGNSNYISIFNSRSASYPNYNWYLRAYNLNNSGKSQVVVVSCDAIADYHKIKGDTMKYKFTLTSSTSVTENEFESVMFPGDVVNEYLAANGNNVTTATGVLPGLIINGSNTTKIEGTHGGMLSFYSNSVSLGDLDLGRTDSATNWSEDQLFMYNGDSTLTTNKGAQLKALIEQKGETIYASKPEYAYYLTPDALKEIRYYNDAVGYELNYNNLKNYGANTVACSTTSCGDSIYDSEGEPKVIFQHYGSKFLAGEAAQSIKINNFSYGAIKAANDRICIIGSGSLDNMTNMIENQKCRWIDYVQTGNNYTDPATGETPVAFRLAF